MQLIYVYLYGGKLGKGFENSCKNIQSYMYINICYIYVIYTGVCFYIQIYICIILYKYRHIHLHVYVINTYVCI